MNTNSTLNFLRNALAFINRAMMALSALCLLGAACVLTESVFFRYFLKATTDWQDETCIMLLVAATFLSAASVQSQRGHIGIEALADILPPAADYWRRAAVDVASLAFCLFFSWKSWTLAHEAWTEGTVTSSTFAPPLWIPYSIMSLGMSLLSAQILLQVLNVRAAPAGQTARRPGAH